MVCSPLIWIIAALLLFIIQFAVVIGKEYCHPQKAVTWLVILYIFPVFGIILYYFVGKEYSCITPARSKASKDSALELKKKTLVERCERRLPANLDDSNLFRNSFPVTTGNETTVYFEGKQAFHAIFETISKAEHHIHLEFYIIRDDALGNRLQQLLIRKAQEGVQVRLLYDGFGCRRLKRTFMKKLQNAGVEIGCFLPPLSSFVGKRINYRNHRKIVVVDGVTAFIGGMNVGDEYLGEDPKIGYWRDNHFMVKGDAVPWIQYTFLSDWHTVKGQTVADPAYFPSRISEGNDDVQIVKSGPDESVLPFIFTLIVSAKKLVYIETPYFVPDSCVILALKAAAIRGVDVRVIIPACTDSNLVYWASISYIQELLQAGIRFYKYQKGFIHTKVVICDEIVFSGSTNMDIRSFIGQFEIDAIYYGGRVVAQVMEQFNRDLSESLEIGTKEFANRTLSQKYKEVFGRLLSPLL